MTLFFGLASPIVKQRLASGSHVLGGKISGFVNGVWWIWSEHRWIERLSTRVTIVKYYDYAFNCGTRAQKNGPRSNNKGKKRCCFCEKNVTKKQFVIESVMQGKQFITNLYILTRSGSCVLLIHRITMKSSFFFFSTQIWDSRGRLMQ